MKKEVKELLLATVTEELEKIESGDVISPETIAINYVNEIGDLKLNIVTQSIKVETVYYLNYDISLEKTRFWDTFCVSLSSGRFDKTNPKRNSEFTSLLLDKSSIGNRVTSDISFSNLALGVESSLLGTKDFQGGTLIYDPTRTSGTKVEIGKEKIKTIVEQQDGSPNQLVLLDKLFEKLKELSQIYLQWKEASTSEKRVLEDLFEQLKPIS